jgi:predicted restriction endonuclease
MILSCGDKISFATYVRKDSRRIYKESGKEYKCSICGYDTHVEIAHIKAVADFNNEALLEEINSIDNLIALCPNHHWEYDNQKLKL